MTKEEALKKLVNAGLDIDEAIKIVNESEGFLEGNVKLALMRLKGKPAERFYDR